MAVNINEYEKALVSLEAALLAPKNDLSRDATIQRFEFTVELAWKTTKKFMGTSTSSPKQVIREMAQNGFIEDIDLWLRAIDERNISSHTYNEDLAEQVYKFAQNFLPFSELLLAKLKA